METLKADFESLKRVKKNSCDSSGITQILMPTCFHKVHNLLVCNAAMPLGLITCQISTSTLSKMWEMARIATEIGLPTNLECNSVVEEAAKMAVKLGHGFVQTHQEKVDQVPD